MRYDYSILDSETNEAEERFKKWIETDSCPFFDREPFINFIPRKDLWSPGAALSAEEIWGMIAKEKGIEI
jgi:hypothetical protein